MSLINIKCFKQIIAGILIWCFSSHVTKAQFNDGSVKNGATIVGVSGPSQVKLADTTKFVVRFGVGNTCGYFNKFIESKDHNIYEIIVITASKGSVCMAMPVIKETTYYFKPERKGIYYLMFKQNDDWLTKKVLVQ